MVCLYHVPNCYCLYLVANHLRPCTTSPSQGHAGAATRYFSLMGHAGAATSYFSLMGHTAKLGRWGWEGWGRGGRRHSACTHPDEARGVGVGLGSRLGHAYILLLPTDEKAEREPTPTP